MPSDADIIREGKDAWRRIKKSRIVEDYVACGRALLIGRRVAMAKAGTDQPKGGKYARYFASWIRANGFDDMTHSARHCCLQLAENETGVVAWRKTLPGTNRPCIYPNNLWNKYRTTVLGRPSKATWRNRLRIDEAAALLARDAARLAAKDAARGQYVAATTVEMIADACLIAILNTFDIVVPSPLARAYTNGAGKRATTKKNGTGVAARA